MLMTWNYCPRVEPLTLEKRAKHAVANVPEVFGDEGNIIRAVINKSAIFAHHISEFFSLRSA